MDRIPPTPEDVGFLRETSVTLRCLQAAECHEEMLECLKGVCDGEG